LDEHLTAYILLSKYGLMLLLGLLQVRRFQMFICPETSNDIY